MKFLVLGGGPILRQILALPLLAVGEAGEPREVVYARLFLNFGR